MTDTAESLDPLRLPLIGERLIEASAGTGKTFTIAALYLRLLLVTDFISGMTDSYAKNLYQELTGIY